MNGTENFNQQENEVEKITVQTSETVTTNNSNKKMKNCQTCGTMIAKSAKHCPACGAKNKKKFYQKKRFWIIIIIFLSLFINNINNTFEQESKVDKYTGFVDYIKENGIYENGNYKISKQITELSNYFTTQGEISVCVDSKNKIFFEEIGYYDSHDIYISVSCDNTTTTQTVKITQVFDTFTLNSSATIDPMIFSETAQIVESYSRDSAPFGESNAKAVITENANLLLSYMSFFLDSLDFEISMSELGFENY